MPPSQASIFFDKIIGLKSRAFDYLCELAQPSSRTEENEWRDFKGAGFITASIAPDADPKKENKVRDDKIKSIWSENLGAFSNSGGGVLIWGIKAPNKFAAGIDLSSDAPALKDRLVEIANDAIDPPVLSVQVRSVTRKGNSQRKGFVVCYVPDSEFSPHRSIWAKREYYIRAQDGNYSIPTALLRRMFYPRSAPLLVPIANAKLDKEDDLHVHLQMSVDITNRGMASGDEVLVRFDADIQSQYRTYPNSQYWLKPEPTNNFRSLAPIHPGATVRLLNNCSAAYDAWPQDHQVLRFRFSIFARDASPLFSEISYTAEELHRAAINCRSIVREGVAYEKAANRENENDLEDHTH
jgi:hypothetical protein